MAAATRRIAGWKVFILALVALSMTLALPAFARGAEVGAVPDITWGTSRADVDRTIALMKETGIRSVRANISWAALEQQGKGHINQGALADADYAVDAARGAGLDVLLPVSDGVPYWASADPRKYRDGSGEHWNKTWRPRNSRDYADFMRFVVDRYSPRGVHAYEVWNEPNLERFWASGVNAGEYVELLKAAYPAIKQADPSATVVLGGLSKSDYPFLERLYDAGAKPYFDVAAVHPYTGRVEPGACWNQGGTSRKALDSFCALEEVRRVMVANGDSAKKVWLTELGWSSYNGEWGVSEANQAKYLTEALVKLESYPWVEKAYIYGFRNLYWSHDKATDIEANFGLVRTDFSAKPALRAVRAYATGREAAPAPAAPVRRRRTHTTVEVLRTPARRARSSSLVAMAATGQVKGADRGRVEVTLQRRSGDGGRWVARRELTARLDRDGGFAVRLPLSEDGTVWRLKASFAGTSEHAASESEYRRFSA